MTTLRRILRYEIKFTLGWIAGIVVLCAAVSLMWPHASWWIFALIGVAYGISESRVTRWVKRRSHGSA